MLDPIVEAVGLTKTYGDFVAVDDISFNIYGGEIVGFLGPNGAGKNDDLKNSDRPAAAICRQGPPCWERYSA